jgi:hypothetical protein
MVNRKSMMKVNIHAASKEKLSGQLRFLGLFIEITAAKPNLLGAPRRWRTNGMSTSFVGQF